MVAASRSADDAGASQEASAVTSGDGVETSVEHVHGLISSATRLLDAQVRLWLAELRRAAGRIILSALLCVLALVLALVAAAFLYAGVFHFLTDYLHVPTAWALVIFAGVHGLAAGVLVLLALRLLRQRRREKDARRHL